MHTKAKAKKTSVNSQQGTNDDDSSLGWYSTDSEWQHYEVSDASILGWSWKKHTVWFKLTASLKLEEILTWSLILWSFVYGFCGFCLMREKCWQFYRWMNGGQNFLPQCKMMCIAKCIIGLLLECYFTCLTWQKTSKWWTNIYPWGKCVCVHKGTQPIRLCKREWYSCVLRLYYTAPCIGTLFMFKKIWNVLTFALNPCNQMAYDLCSNKCRCRASCLPIQ